jgi:hypothetical protein
VALHAHACEFAGLVEYHNGKHTAGCEIYDREASVAYSRDVLEKSRVDLVCNAQTEQIEALRGRARGEVTVRGEYSSDAVLNTNALRMCGNDPAVVLFDAVKVPVSAGNRLLARAPADGQRGAENRGAASHRRRIKEDPTVAHDQRLELGDHMFYDRHSDGNNTWCAVLFDDTEKARLAGHRVCELYVTAAAKRR